jgi:hypothetical protein
MEMAQAHFEQNGAGGIFRAESKAPHANPV